MSLHDTIERFGTTTGDQVLDLWHRWQAGEFTETEFRSLSVAVLVRAGARSAALADLYLSTVLASPPVGLQPFPGAPGAAERAVDESLASESYNRDSVAAVAVLGAAFTYESFQRHTSYGMGVHGVQFWVRIPEPGACEMCSDLASQGAAPVDVDMYTHRACRCIAQPTEGGTDD